MYDPENANDQRVDPEACDARELNQENGSKPGCGAE